MPKEASQAMQAMAEVLRSNSLFRGDSPDFPALRAAMIESALPLPAGTSRSEVVKDGLKLTRITTPEARQDYALLYFHGGGYTIGSVDSHAELMARLAACCRAPVLGLDYRLAPEHPFPAAVDDAVGSYEQLLSQGLAAKAIVIGGDSAGGGLALACLLRLKETHRPLPAAALLFSPWTDLTASGDSNLNRRDLDPMVSAELLQPMAAAYANGQALDNPLLSPLFGDLSGLPPLLIQVGDHEILLDDSVRLAERARAAAVTVTLEHYPGAFHVFQSMPQLPESAAALHTVGAFFAEHTDP